MRPDSERSARLPDRLRTALARRRAAGMPGAASVARERRAPGLTVSDIVCTSGPSDVPFDERHGHVSIAAVLAGTFAYRGEHGRVLLTPGALLLGNAGECFRCSHEHGEGDRCLAVHCEAAWFERVAADLGVRRTRFGVNRLPPSRVTAGLIAGAEAALDASDRLNGGNGLKRGDGLERTETDAAELQGTELEERVLALTAAVVCASQETRPAVVTPRDERRAAEVARLLEDAFDRRQTLAALAAHADMSPFHFLRVFRNVVGATPHQFVLRLRLRAAARLLRATDLPATDIAYIVGFEDLSNFVRTFRAELGLPPARYRAGARTGATGSRL